MSRTTPAAVQGLLGGNYDGSADLAPFIATASVLVDDLVADAAARSLTVSATKAELIERWLAAHCYHPRDQFYQSRSTGGASGSFQGQTGMRLENSLYGQQALTLDTTGFLARLNAGNKQVQFLWLGRYPSAQTPWEEKS